MCLILVVGVFIIRVQYSIRDDTRRQMASPDQTAPHHFQLEPRDWVETWRYFKLRTQHYPLKVFNTTSEVDFIYESLANKTFFISVN